VVYARVEVQLTMCDLCSGDVKVSENAHNDCMVVADCLETLARYYRDMGNGVLLPHSNQAAVMGNLARSIVRELVKEWV
jgi:hypothetical protein